MPLASLNDWLMFLHVLAAMVWVGGLVALNAFGVLALRAGDRDAVARFIGSFRAVGPFVLMPAAIAVLVLGVWMVLVDEAWTCEQTWIWLAVALVGAVFLSRAALAAQRAVDAGDLVQATRQLRRWSWGIRLIILLLVVATWDMVFKPGA